ncbi:MAG: protein kinase [Planctomycetota bacterium]
MPTPPTGTTTRVSRDEAALIGPDLVRHGGLTQDDVDRLVAAWKASSRSSFIDYLVDVRFLNAFGARVILATLDGTASVPIPDIIQKLRAVGKLVMPADLAAVRSPMASDPIRATYTEADTPPVGTRLGRFSLDEVLGEGSTSVTYRAFHTALGVPVAVKVFKRRSQAPGAANQFVREARLLARIDHPAIVRVIDVDHDGGMPYIVFEYVGAMTLEEAITAFGPLDARRVARFGARLAAGLSTAHKLGVLHRDIKPANILVRKDGQSKLADFGLALLGDSDREARGQIVGTPAYMAPEVVVQSETIDHRADMYSLGATLFHAAVGHPPFPRGDVTQMLLAHVNDEPHDVYALDPFFDQELSDIILRLLSKRPDERYRTWDEVHDAFAISHVYQGKSARNWATTTSSVMGPQVVAGMVVAERFRTEEFVSSEAASVTYRAQDLHGNRPVYLRFLRAEVFRQSPDALAEIEQDVRRASRLRHSGVLHTEPLVQLDSMPTLVMDYFDGEPLSRRIRSASRPISLDVAMHIIQQLSEALAAGHQAGLVHSGIQPQSVLLDAGNRVKVAGFGLARLTGHYRTTQSGVMLGPLDYISPEQCQGQATDQRSDVYSFGCVAYELLTGRAPFFGEPVLSALQAHVEKPPRPLRELERRLPESVEQIVMRCLAKAPADRFQNMGEVSRAFARVPNTRLITRDSMREFVGEMIGERYRVEELIGHGAMGAVYRAFDLKLEELVAIKVLKAEFLRANADAVARFKQEIRIARRISHPNVVRVHDFDEFDGLAVLSMEHFDGRDLKSWLDERGRLPWDEAVRAMIQAGEGLAAAHRLGIVHRDVKPHNVLMNDDARVKLLDFGIAALTGQKMEGETEERIVGTPDYISPEQCNSEAVDQRCDVYSFGCTLYQALTGEPPFRADSLMAMLVAHIQKPAPHAADLVDDIPAELDALVRRCMAKEASDRYQSMLDVVADLRSMVVDPPIAASSSDTW